MLKLALIKRLPNFLLETRLTQYVFGRSREKYIEEKSIISISTCYKHNQNVLELKELRGRADVLTLTESRDISANMHEVIRDERRRNRHFVEAG